MAMFRNSYLFRYGILLVTLSLTQVATGQAKEKLDLHRERLELPGAPAALLPVDLDGDDRLDLLAVLALTAWDQIGIEESTEMDGIEGLVEVLTIVPALVERREIRGFLARGQGYEPLPEALEIDASVLSLQVGTTGAAAVALTDEGASLLHFEPESQTLRLEPWIEDPPVLARSATFVSRLELVHDFDGDGRGDFLLPASDGAALYLGTDDGLARTPTTRIPLPTDHTEPASGRVRHYPLPKVRDVDGDGLLDLLLPHHRIGWREVHVVRNAGGGRFENPLGPVEPGRGDAFGAHFGDLDGDGVAEWVTQEDRSQEDVGMRQEFRQAKNPPSTLRFHHPGEDFAPDAEPYETLDIQGFTLGDGEGEGEIRLPAGFQDLDGDGRQDLITISLDFSMLQAVRILTVKSLNIGLDFNVWCQTPDGSFQAVSDLDLSGRFRLNLNDLRLARLSQFAGDFDGDGRADFLQMGRGRKVTVHRGQEGCAYAPQPDLTLTLEEEPRNMALVRVRELNGDGRADLTLIHPGKAKEPGLPPPVHLDLYLSREVER